jgi:hypothetical protein
MTKVTCHITRARLILAILPAIHIGCAPLAEVREFAGLSKKAAESFPGMMADLKHSVVREKQYDALRTGLQLEAAIKAAEAACDSDSVCRNVDDYVAVSRVMENYMKVMGQLAADELASYDKSIDPLVEKLSTSAKIKKEEAAAAGSLAKFVANAVADGYRKRVVAKTLVETNASFLTLTRTLADFTGDYQDQLERERIAMRAYFELAVAGHSAEEPLTKLLIYDLYRNDVSALENRLAAAKAYTAFLATVGKAHDQLSGKASKLDAREVRQLTATYALTIDKQMQVIRKAF